MKFIGMPKISKGRGYVESWPYEQDFQGRSLGREYTLGGFSY